MSEFSKFAGYKINIHNLIAFPYTGNEETEIEIKISLNNKKNF